VKDIISNDMHETVKVDDEEDCEACNI
jgi:hypothetical protein